MVISITILNYQRVAFLAHIFSWIWSWKGPNLYLKQGLLSLLESASQPAIAACSVSLLQEKTGNPFPFM